jgi:hypothetical protein
MKFDFSFIVGFDGDSDVGMSSTSEEVKFSIQVEGDGGDLPEILKDGIKVLLKKEFDYVTTEEEIKKEEEAEKAQMEYEAKMAVEMDQVPDWDDLD